MKKSNLLMLFVAICGFATGTRAQVPTYVPSNGLAAWYSFNNNANDLSGNGNNGTVIGATLTSDRFGNANNAYLFDGTTSHISLNNLICNFGTSDFTLSAWEFKFDTLVGGSIIGKRNSPGDGNMLILGSAPNYEISTGANDYVNFTKPFQSTNVWFHTVLVRTGVNLKLYLNGNLIDNKNLSKIHNINNSATTEIGARYSGSSIWNLWHGKIDDIGIWNRALTQQEITSLYNACTNPSASINPQGSTTFCTGGFVSLLANTGTGYTYQWFLNSVPISNSNSSSYIATQTGNYTVEVNDNGCKALSSAVLVTVNNPPSNVVNASGSTTFCSGSSVTLTAQGSGTYLWNTGATTQSINVSQSGSYSVTVTANSCSSNSQAVQVTVNSAPQASITPSGPTTFCSGGSVTLTASGGGSYQWNTGSNANAITVNQSGTYVVTVTANACTANASQQVTVNSNPNVSLASPGSFIILSAAPVVLSGSPSGGVYAGSGVGANMFYPANAGLGQHTLTYTYTNNFGCVGSATQGTLVYDTLKCSVSTTDTLFIKVAVVGITPPNNISTIKVFPNPTNDHITIDYGNYLILNGYTMKITNSLGQLVYVSAVNQASQYLSLASWGGSGLYYVYLLDPQNNTVSVKEIVLQ